MTREQWNDWLVYARSEKKSRQALSTPAAPPAYKIASIKNSTPSRFVQDIIRSGDSRRRSPASDLHQSESASSSDAPKSPLAETPKAPLRRYELDEGIALSSSNPPPPPPSEDLVKFSRSKTPPSMEKNRPTASSNPRVAPTRPSSAPRLRGRANVTAPGGISCGTPRRFDETKLKGHNMETPTTRLSSPSAGRLPSPSASTSPTRARSQSPERGRRDRGRHSPRFDRPSGDFDRSIGDMGLGNSNGSNNSSSGRGNLLDPFSSSSAAPPIQMPFVMGEPPAPSMRKHVSSSGDVFSTSVKKDPAKPFVHKKNVNQPALGDQDNFRHQLFHHTHSTKSTVHPPEVVYKSPPPDVKPTPEVPSHGKRTEDLFSSSNFIPEDTSTEYQDDQSMSPTAIAAAKASALRIDSAYAAAECMKASLKAEVESDDNSKASTTMAMLDVMMKSLEKSKVSLNEILHSPDKDKGSLASSGGSREGDDQHSGKKASQSRRHERKKSPQYYSDDNESNSDDRNEQYGRSNDHKKHGSRSRNGLASSKPRNAYGSPSPDMSLLRTNELGGGSLDDRWDNNDNDDINSIPFGAFSSSKRGFYDSVASPNRVYKSSLLESSAPFGFENTATKSDFNELQRFGKSLGNTSSPEGDVDAMNNTTSSGNMNKTAAVVARFKQSKSGQPAKLETPRVWRICLSQGPLLKVRSVLTMN